MTISYKKLHALVLMLIAPVFLHAMEPIPTKKELTDALYDAVQVCYQYQRPVITPADPEYTVIKQLLEQRADTNPVDWKPLGIAASRGQLHLVKLLLDHNASINQRELYGTPLEQATRHKHQQIVELLLMRKASIQNGSTLLFNSIYGGTINYALIAFFLRHPHMQAYDLASRYVRLSMSKKEKDTLDKARWLTYHADTQARMKEILKATTLDQDTAGIIAQYAGTYHHIEKESIGTSDIIVLCKLTETLNTALPDNVQDLIAEYAVFSDPVTEHPLLPGRPKSDADLTALAQISAAIPTSEEINAAALEKE